MDQLELPHFAPQRLLHLEAPQAAREEPRRLWLACEYTRCWRGCKCNNDRGHGPYWRGYWRDELGKQHSKFLGRELPSWARPFLRARRSDEGERQATPR